MVAGPILHRRTPVNVGRVGGEDCVLTSMSHLSNAIDGFTAVNCEHMGKNPCESTVNPFANLRQPANPPYIRCESIRVSFANSRELSRTLANSRELSRTLTNSRELSRIRREPVREPIRESAVHSCISSRTLREPSRIRREFVYGICSISPMLASRRCGWSLT